MAKGPQQPADPESPPAPDQDPEATPEQSGCVMESPLEAALEPSEAVSCSRLKMLTVLALNKMLPRPLQKAIRLRMNLLFYTADGAITTTPQSWTWKNWLSFIIKVQGEDNSADLDYSFYYGAGTLKNRRPLADEQE